jgi:hypothetical protein
LFRVPSYGFRVKDQTLNFVLLVILGASCSGMKAKSPALELETRNSERETVSWKQTFAPKRYKLPPLLPDKEFEI